MRFWKLAGALTVSLSFINPAYADGPCGAFTSKSAATCEAVEVNFDLSKCKSKTKSGIGKNRCSGSSPVATLKTPEGIYTVALKQGEGWGGANWDAADLSFQAVVAKPKKAARAVAAEPKANPLTILPPTPSNKAPPAEVAVAEEPKEEDAGEGKLSGNWGGSRNTLLKNGISLGAYYTGEVVGNTLGGVEAGTTYMGKVTLATDLDLEKMFGLKGWLFHTSAVSMHGTGPSFLTGDVQMTSNIEANQTSRLYDAWFQKSFADGHGSLLFGLYDWNSENNITDSALVFLNSSFGMGAEASQAPVNGGVSVSTYPTAAMGLRLLLENKGSYINTAV